MSFYSPIASAALRKVTSLGSLKQPQPVKSCDDVNCSGSWNAPRIGPSKPQQGDIFSIPMSIYTPFKTLLGVRVKDSDSYYTAGGTKGSRPCIIIETPKNSSSLYDVLLMATFDKAEEEDVPAPFKRFLIPIATSRRPIKGNAQHIHTTPEWENAPQYLVLIPVKCPMDRLGDRWTSHKADSSKRRFEFYLDHLAMVTLKGLISRKRRHWEEIGKHEHTRAEYLEQLNKLKEGQAQLTRAKSQYTRSQVTRFTSNLPSVAETPEEKDGWKTFTMKRRRPPLQENEPSATRSVKSQRR